MTDIDQVATSVAEQLASDVPEVRLMRLRESDVVVIRVNSNHFSDSDMHYFQERLTESVSVRGVQFVVLGPDMDIEVVRKDGE